MLTGVFEKFKEITDASVCRSELADRPAHPKGVEFSRQTLVPGNFP